MDWTEAAASFAECLGEFQWEWYEDCFLILHVSFKIMNDNYFILVTLQYILNRILSSVVVHRRCVTYHLESEISGMDR